MTKRQLCKALSAVAIATLAGPLARAQPPSWPQRPVRLIVPFPAGGGADLIARQLVDGLGKRFGQPFIVDNRTGASGNIGTDAVAKAAPDGYTLGLVTSGPLVNNKFFYKKMPYDAEKDFTHIAMVCDIPLVIAANPRVMPARNLRELAAAAQAQPAGLVVGTPGNGTIGHLVAASLAHTAKIPLELIPYRGDSAAMTDVLGGAVQATSTPISSYIQALSSGKLRGLAVTSGSRFPGLQDIPTAKEQGFNMEATAWIALVGPAGLPDALVRSLNTEINKILSDTHERARLQQYGAVAITGAPELVRRRMMREATLWSGLISAASIAPE